MGAAPAPSAVPLHLFYFSINDVELAKASDSPEALKQSQEQTD